MSPPINLPPLKCQVCFERPAIRQVSLILTRTGAEVASRLYCADVECETTARASLAAAVTVKEVPRG